MDTVSRIGKICLRIGAFLAVLVYPGFMAMMSAAGWLHNVGTGSYPDTFRSLAGWMIAGGGMLCVSLLLAFLGARPKLWGCNLAAAVLSVTGCTACLLSLHRFCAYADTHFSGIGETMEPVSQLYRDRLLPVLLAAALLLALSLWQLFSDPVREYRIAQKYEKRRRDNAPAPKILGE